MRVTTRRVAVRCDFCKGTGQQPNCAFPFNCDVCGGSGHYWTTETITESFGAEQEPTP